MKKIIFIVTFFLILSDLSYGQILPANRYFYNNRLLDLTLQPASFAYSFRKLRTAYTGFALKVRRGTDNAEADVAFDIKEIVSLNSLVTVTFAGTSSLIVGQTLTYSAFINSQTIYVNTWYDQSKKIYNAIQTDVLLQPKIVLNSSGVSNDLPSILFNGANRERLIILQPIQNLALNGVSATYMTVLKPTENSKEQLSFGLQTGGNRWTLSTNWNDDNLYFDSSEGTTCCASNRSFQNNTNMFFYKQYSFVRGSTYKTARFNSTSTILNNSPSPSTPFTGGNFGIGYWYLDCCLANPGFYGNVSEIVMFPIDLQIPELLTLEINQKNFWQL